MQQDAVDSQQKISSIKEGITEIQGESKIDMLEGLARQAQHIEQDIEKIKAKINKEYSDLPTVSFK